MGKFRDLFEEVLNETSKKEIFLISKINKDIKQDVVLEIDASSLIKDRFMGIIYENFDNRIKYISYPFLGYKESFNTLKTALNHLRKYLKFFEKEHKYEDFRKFDWRNKVKFNDKYITKSMQKNFIAPFMD